MFDFAGELRLKKKKKKWQINSYNSSSILLKIDSEAVILLVVYNSCHYNFKQRQFFLISQREFRDLDKSCILKEKKKISNISLYMCSVDLRKYSSFFLKHFFF